jgi:hypothetical protein
MAKIWPEEVCRSIWAFVESRAPGVFMGGVREWSNWNDGAITEKRPLRTVQCAACGNCIPKGETALYALDCANAVDQWAPLRRFIHRNPCI